MEPAIREFCILPKYDGIALRIYFGRLFVTRFDQVYGLDITPKCQEWFGRLLKRDISCLENVILRGEIITLVDHEGYKTKQSYASGMVANEVKFTDDIKFICYEYVIMDKNGKPIPQTYEQMLQNIKKTFDFKHVARKVDTSELSIKAITDLAEKIPKEYLTDGIVLRPNDAMYCFENKEKPLY